MYVGLESCAFLHCLHMMSLYAEFCSFAGCAQCPCAQGQCVRFSGNQLGVKYTKCPFTVTSDLMHPEEPFPWVPPEHESAIFTTSNATLFLHDNSIVSDKQAGNAAWLV